MFEILLFYGIITKKFPLIFTHFRIFNTNIRKWRLNIFVSEISERIGLYKGDNPGLY